MPQVLFIFIFLHYKLVSCLPTLCRLILLLFVVIFLNSFYVIFYCHCWWLLVLLNVMQPLSVAVHADVFCTCRCVLVWCVLLCECGF